MPVGLRRRDEIGDGVVVALPRRQPPRYVQLAALGAVHDPLHAVVVHPARPRRGTVGAQLPTFIKVSW